jgi:glycine hydroxymethyltransferase
MAVFTGLLQPGDLMMGLNLTHGGHLTHGYCTPKRKVSASSIFWESEQYEVNLESGLIDYDKLHK